MITPCPPPPPRQPSWPVPEYDPDVHPLAQPPLDFTCPESALCLAHTPYSDMYSLAALVYAVFTRGGTVFNCAADWYAYKKAMNEVREALEDSPARSRATCSAFRWRSDCREMNLTPSLSLSTVMSRTLTTLSPGCLFCTSAGNHSV